MEDELITLTRTVERARRIKQDARTIYGIGSKEYTEAQTFYRLACADLRALSRP